MELLNMIVLLCQVHTGTANPVYVLNTQIKCEQEYVSCFQNDKKKGTTSEKLMDCILVKEIK